jgi:hypothetical protein
MPEAVPDRPISFLCYHILWHSNACGRRFAVNWLPEYGFLTDKPVFSSSVSWLDYSASRFSCAFLFCSSLQSLLQVSSIWIVWFHAFFRTLSTNRCQGFPDPFLLQSKMLCGTRYAGGAASMESWSFVFTVCPRKVSFSLPFSKRLSQYRSFSILRVYSVCPYWRFRGLRVQDFLNRCCETPVCALKSKDSPESLNLENMDPLFAVAVRVASWANPRVAYPSN